MPYADLVSSPIDTIDPVSGKLNLSFTLGSLPPGPGGTGFDVVLTYDSHLYDTRTSYLPAFNGFTQQYVIRQFTQIDPGHNGGWKYNFDNLGFFEETKEDVPTWVPDPWSGGGQYITYPCIDENLRFIRMRVGLPDGSEHIMHLHPYANDSNPNSNNLYSHDGFAGLAPDGRARASQCSSWAPINGILTYYSHDGSYLKLEIEADGSDWRQKEWTLYYPDGSRVTGVHTTINAIYDPNGNMITIANLLPENCPSGNPCAVIENDLGDTIVLDRTSQGSYFRDTITSSGPNGNSAWSVDWQTQGGWSKYYQIYECGAWGDQGGGCDSASFAVPVPVPTSVVRYIQMPLAAHTPLGGQPVVYNSYEFQYSDANEVGSGEVNYVRTPSGANYSYVWSVDGIQNVGSPDSPDGIIKNRVVSKLLHYTGDNCNPCTYSWTHQYENESLTRITGPGGLVTEYSYGSYSPWGTNLVTEIAEKYGTTTLRSRQRSWAQNEIYSFIRDFASTTFARNPYMSGESTTIYGSSPITSTVGYGYDKNGNLTSKAESGLRTTTNEYYATASSWSSPNGYWQPHTSPPYSPRRVNSIKRSIVAGDGTGSATDYAYYIESDAFTTGNHNYEYKWDSEKGSLSSFLSNPSSYSQVWQYGYDSYGNRISIIEPQGMGEPARQTQIIYDGSNSRIASVIQSSTSITNYTWRPNGAIESKVDANTGVTLASYSYDSGGRRTGVTEAGIRSTGTSYEDQYLRITTTLPSGLQSTTNYDQVGRAVFTQNSDGSKVTTTHAYFGGGRRTITSKPYFTEDAYTEWVCTEYDLIGRVTAVAVFKGGAPTSCTQTGNRTGITQTTYNGAVTTITDPAGKVRTQTQDPLGRLIEVVEDPSGLNYHTTYYYDVHDNLTGVSQGGQARSFVYTSLGQLKTATNPESGSINYTYYGSGDLKTRTDARGITATMAYDELHRIVSKTYSNEPAGSETPDVTYQYYSTSQYIAAPLRKRLKKVITSVADTTYEDYDALGRVLRTKQNIAGYSANPIQIDYTWFPHDVLSSQTYPSGRVVSYGADSVGRTVSAVSGIKTYADSVEFTADGRMKQMRMGNNLWATMAYYPPGTPTEYRLRQGDSDLLKLEYNFSGTTNNGNVLSQTTSRGGINWEQDFEYDNVNRLTRVTETGGQGTNFVRKYGYGNQYGNRYIDPTSPGVDFDIHEAQSSTDFNGANQQTTAGAVYDAAGNQMHYSPFTLIYDAENRNTSMTSASSGNGAFYYDAEGHRVKKEWTPSGGATTTTYYVYNALGQMIAEYSPEISASGTTYPFADMLGSIRAVTTESGSVAECYDYLPFGRLLNGEFGRNAACFGSGGGIMPQKFTGKELDPETGLDFFGARYLSSAQGRFLTPDPEGKGASLFHPQSWNAYSYVLNSPNKYIDPDGEIPLLVATSLIGAGVGAVGSAGTSIAQQWMAKGFKNIDPKAVGTAAAGGFVQGGLAGLTMGVLGVSGPIGSGVIGSVTNAAGGATTRELNELLDVPNDVSGDEAVSMDFVSGFLGGYVGAKMANKYYAIPNVRRQIAKLALKEKLRKVEQKFLNRYNAISIKNSVIGSTLGTAAMNFSSGLLTGAQGLFSSFGFLDLISRIHDEQSQAAQQQQLSQACVTVAGKTTCYPY
jgi:RHS repeat-associated protein